MTRTQKSHTGTAKAYVARVGYFQESDTLVYTRCPDCRTHVDAQVVAWAKPRDRQAALADMLAEHFIDCAKP